MARRSRPWSLVRRLTGGVALIALLAFVSQALVLDFWLRPLLDELAAGIATQAQSIQTALASVPAGERALLARRLSNERLRVSHDAPAAIDAPGPPKDFALALQSRLGRDVTLRGDLRPRSGFGVVLGMPVADDLWWVSFDAAGPEAAVLNTVVLWLAVLALVTLSAMLLSVRYIARPIGLLAAQIGGQRGRLRTIAEDPRASDELRRLVASFNDLVQRIDVADSTHQQLLAGVSHDLRTPLARLRLRAETQCEPAVADAMAGDLHSLERIVDQFLAYVQGDHVPRAGRAAPLAAVVAELVERYVLQGAPVSARLVGSGPLLPDVSVQRLVGNLVDNALAYGQAPVLVEMSSSDAGVSLRVLDHGLGMSQAEFEIAKQPFVRLSAARGDLGHCGLGLAIVAQIARHWGGELKLAHAAGASGVEVSIPHG